MKKPIIIQLTTLICFWIVFFELQNPTIYKNSLGLISDNWQNKNGERSLVNAPYEKLTNDNYVQWDAKHYFQIRNYGYDIEKAGGDYIFAFFPLFPLIWKITNLPPIGILFLNYLFFSLSILILLKTLSAAKDYSRNTTISLCFPGIILFFIPYTEATYMLMISVGIYGFAKNRYWIYFFGFLIASMTRPSISLLLLSIISAESFYFFSHRRIILLLRKTMIRILPLLIGTMIVSLVQINQKSGSLFKFIEVQKYWERVFAIPHNLRDWSHESFAINIGVIFIIFIPLLMLLIILLKKQLAKKEKNDIINYEDPRSYLSILSIIYIIGNTLFILLFQGGSLHNLFRYSLCAPFFFILLYIAFDHVKQISLSFRFFVVGTLSFSSLFVLGLTDYSAYWNFSDFGIFVLIGTLFFWLFQDFKSSLIYKAGSIFLIIINIIWTTYLFNTYIANGWIFA